MVKLASSSFYRAVVCDCDSVQLFFVAIFMRFFWVENAVRGVS